MSGVKKPPSKVEMKEDSELASQLDSGLYMTTPVGGKATDMFKKRDENPF